MKHLFEVIKSSDAHFNESSQPRHRKSSVGMISEEAYLISTVVHRVSIRERTESYVLRCPQISSCLKWICFREENLSRILLASVPPFVQFI